MEKNKKVESILELLDSKMISLDYREDIITRI